MLRTAHIDVAEGEQPSSGEKFVISLQENSEMLGQLDDGRTFRFTSPSSAERDYAQENRSLTVTAFDLAPADALTSDLAVADANGPRLVGTLTYTE